MVDGYEGFPERDLLSQLCHGAIEMFDLKKEKVVLSSEGLYTRCGFTTPGGQFWIHADYDRQKGKDGRVGGYVTFNNPTKPAAVAKGDFHHLEDHLVPKYGYLACASASEPSGLSYRKHHPTGEVNPHVALLAKFKYQYVGLQQILDYLKVVASAAGSTSRPDFHVWLMQAKPGVTKVQAMYRGCLDDRVLKQSGLDGAFTGVDFSYTVFRNVTLGNLRQAKLIGCTFLQCKATGDALSGADLSLSKVDQCDFQGLRGVITLNYGLLARTTFGGCTFTVTSFNGMEYDDFTLQSFSTSVAHARTESSLVPDERLYEMLVETKLKHERLTALLQEKEDAARVDRQNRDANRELLHNLLEADSERQVVQNERMSTVEAELLELKQHLRAYDRDTLKESLCLIKPPAATDEHDNATKKIFEVLFFNKPMKLLKMLERRKDVVKWNELPRTFAYNTDGRDGESGEIGHDGLHGSAPGIAGTDAVNGVNGQHGSSATPNIVSLMSVPNQRIFVVSPKEPDADAVILPLYDGKVSITLSAMGGAGGKGGNGGRGGDGRDAEMVILPPHLAGIHLNNQVGNMIPGKPGGNSGKGGNGGMGGNAGHSGSINVMVREDDMDLLSLISSVNNGAAKLGEKGDFGLGGTPGKGTAGVGPKSRRGADGAPGQNGLDGRPGLAGHAGSVTYTVVNFETGEVNEYASLYKLQLTKIASFTSPTGIIEPGQRVRIPPFLLTNNGGMPTPDTHLVISVNGDSYILVDEGKCTYEITEKVLAGRSLEITKPLFFRVAEGLNPSFLAETLVSRTNLNLGAAFPRTNVVFKEFLHVPVPINITRPLELSLATGAGIIISDQAAPVSITVANRTRVGFGSSAAQPRLVRLIIELVNCEGHSYVTASACAGSRLPDTIFSLNAPVVYEIDYIPPESEVTISGVVRLDPDQVQLYQHLLFRFSLSVGDVNHPMQQSGLEVIQEKSHSMQVTEYCPASPAATDCMLVVTNTTTAEEIDYWRACFAALGFTMCVWNVALYNGLTYASPLLNFHVSFSGKLVVILNAPFYREDQPPATRQPCYPLTYLESTEVFEAARRYGVRTYIVNYTTPAQPTSEHHHNFSQMLLPMADLKAHSARIADSAFEGRTELYEHMLTVPGSRDELLPAQHTQCKVKLYRAIMTPTESDYNDRMAQLGINIKVCRPDRQYFLCKAFATAVRGEGPNQHGIFRRFDCGHVELRRGLDTTNALVASTAVQAANPVNRPQATTVYVLLKLLPILTKLQMFSTNYTQDSLYREVVAALLSDLADEQHLFITAAEKLPMIGYKKEKELMPSMMVTLITLKGFDFSVLCREEAGRKSLSDFLLRLAFTASQYKQGGIAGQVAKSVQTTCAAVMKSYLGVQGEGEFDGLVRSFGSTQQIGGGYANMIALLRDPRGLSRDVLFNHTVKFSTEVVVGTQTLKSPPTATLLRAALPDMRCETEFTAALAMLSQSPRYHTTDRPAFYPQDPSERVPVDSAHRTVAYSVRGVEPETRVEA